MAKKLRRKKGVKNKKHISSVRQEPKDIQIAEEAAVITDTEVQHVAEEPDIMPEAAAEMTDESEETADSAVSSEEIIPDSEPVTDDILFRKPSEKLHTSEDVSELTAEDTAESSEPGTASEVTDDSEETADSPVSSEEIIPDNEPDTDDILFRKPSEDELRPEQEVSEPLTDDSAENSEPESTAETGEPVSQTASQETETEDEPQIPETEETAQEEPVPEPEPPVKEISVFMEPPHWVHHTKTDDSVVGGIIYLPQCDCSVCGFTVNMEKKICPHCGSKME